MPKSPYSRSNIAKANDYWRPGMPDRRAVDRDSAMHVTRAEMASFRTIVTEWMGKMDCRMDKQDMALFAPDDKNQNNQPGIMVTVKRINNHISTTCMLWRVAAWIAGGVASGALFAKHMGLF